MKANWERKKLGEVCEIYQPQTISSKELKDDGKYPVYGANGVIGFYDKYNHKDSEVLLTCRGSTCGTVNKSVEFSWVNGNAMVMHPINAESLAKEYLFMVLKSLDYSHIITGAAQPQITRQTLAPAEIPLPPLAEQKRIVGVLDKKFAAVEKLRSAATASLQDAKDLFQSELTKAFSNDEWEMVYLKDIAKDFGRGKSKHRPRNDKCLFGGDYPFIQTGDIRNSEKFVTDYAETYNDIGLQQSKLWPKGTLCITIAANIAETAILTFPSCFPDSVIGFVPNENKTSADFVFYLLQYFKSELQILGKGAAQDNINLGTFEKMQFPLPPLADQKRIVARLDSLQAKVRMLQANYEKVIADCDELKQSYLDKAFKGEL